jgi:predicted Fe-Mo cluster-binding NifX family protein
MMDELKEKLHTEQCSLVVLHEGNINTFDGRGVRKLYNLINDEPELFLEAKIADKAIGRTAAKMMVDGGVSEVYADVISEQALNTLEDAGIRVSYEKKVDHRTFLKIWEKLGEIV